MTSLYNQDEDGSYRAALTEQSNYWRDMYHDELAHVERLNAPRKADWIMRGWLTLVGLALAFLVFTAGYSVGRNHPTGPVCTAPTEDSVIVDCDYRDGGWYPK